MARTSAELTEGEIQIIEELDNVANSSDVTKNPSGNIEGLLFNRSAIVAPAVTDDSNSGYAIGSRWIDTTADKEYVALDVSVGAAVWKESTATGGIGDFLADGSVPMTGAIDETKGGDIASATTTNIGAATGNFVDITGTTTITGFGTVQAGVQRTLQFDAALILTHNGTSLILPTAANITTVAGDTCDMISLGSGNWLCVNYQRADGSALTGGGGLSWGDTIDGTAESQDGITIDNIPNTFAGINTNTNAANAVGFESNNTTGKGIVLTALGGANIGIEVNDTSTSNKYSTSLKIEQHDNDGLIINVRDGSAFSRPMLIRDLGTLTAGITFAEINTGADAQAHTGLNIDMDNASTGARHIILEGTTTGGGIEFPDSTVQTTAFTGGGLSVDALGATRSMTAANATITHSHSLGKIPSIIEVAGIAGSSIQSFGTWINGANRTSFMRKNGTVGQTSTASSIICKESDNTGQAAIINNVTSTQFDVVWTRSSGAASATIAVGFTILG